MTFMLSADEFALCEPNRVRNEIRKVLNDAKDRGWDDLTLKAASGVKARCIKSYRVEGREPSLSNALSLLCVLGQSDLNRILNLIGYHARPLDESDKKPCGEVVACILTHGSVIATAAADGRVDHTEEPAVRFAADSAIEALLPYSSAGAAA